MNGMRVANRPPRRHLSAKKRAIKDALWAIHFYGAEFNPGLVPDQLRPMPLTDAIIHATQWDDEHACDRRVRSLRRLQPDFLSAAETTPDAQQAKAELLRGLDPQCADRYGRSFRTDLYSTHELIDKVRTEVETTDHARCIPLIDDPDFDPVSGQTYLHSELTVRRPLDRQLACLLDPRGWDDCSDLFDETYEVVRHPDGDYVPGSRDHAPLGANWDGLLYERAGVGPQVVENIMWIDFKVDRTCGGRTAPTALCKAEKCDHIETVDIKYGLCDSLSYELGWVELSGVMRQNHGFYHAERKPDGTTKVICEKTVRFGRVTDWSASGGGGFDYGEILNYMAPTYLSLWIYDVTVVVPCCNKIKNLDQPTGD